MTDVLAIGGITAGALALLIVIFGYRRERRWRVATEIKAAWLARLLAENVGGRSGLERLLVAHPFAEVAWVENQREEICTARRQNPPPYDPRLTPQPGPWTCVDLYEAGEILRFAIWNRTDDVYALDAHGAVGDEPCL